MLYLLIDQLERVGFIIATAFFLSRQRKLRSFMQYQGKREGLWQFILLFSFFAILGTYSGIRITGVGYKPEPLIFDVAGTEAIANARTIGVVIAGLLGGWKTGLTVGVIAGVHRYLLGGFAALPCMVAPIIQGVLAGCMKNTLKKHHKHSSSVWVACAVGFGAEILQMLVILLLARPAGEAIALVETIGIPQVFSNGLGVALFFAILIEVEREEERIGAEYASKAMQSLLVANAEIKALQAQMNPHFLFNVLNSIKALIRTNPENARQMITLFSKYIRKNMQSAGQDLIPIREELAHIRVYLDLIKFRMGDLIDIKWDVDDSCLSYELPPLTIQPIVENAFVHGLKNTVKAGQLLISVKEAQGGITVSVEDNGSGMDNKSGKLEGEEHMGFALVNIQQRLRHYFGEDVTLMIRSYPGIGTAVSFTLPK
ncbi:LytS/YhcK type 5TM receptor domain-containing protein [Aneurinibacillus sp. Ricciae_BoGa-3]|uniref:LytS/YhcK type 5TM receptor domain-containing protein n=1 Tax=Aneurinibacillus sp. Ricciae_BoGa-3 TaxID=3022697 RepID=UPI002340A522|nr:LytS/YhcK type 5TM receptor domain-containing protein [Aneurinibacillus sp. Ricciae_BoGa-3]WCK54475.1 LytS/YhcK type 5TM receptor domain-containing protein [Aneurinibacillus sp. Ricciae_BoGa-3]